jgi:hypothetical protein
MKELILALEKGEINLEQFIDMMATLSQAEEIQQD